MRYAALTEEFLKNGHEVSYITASFSHLHKRFRNVSNLPEKLKIILLPTIPYYKNFHLIRLLSHYRLSVAIRNWLDKQDNSVVPDLVIGASPPIFANYSLARYCQNKNISFIYDIQDLWPEEFVRFLPGKKWLRFILKPLFLKAEQVIEMATAITSVSKNYLDYYIERLDNKPAKVFFLGVDVDKFGAIHKPDNSLPYKIMMLGASQAGNFVMTASRAIQKLPDVEILVVGLREKTAFYRNLIKKENLLRVQILEWLDKEEIYSLLPEFDAGLIFIHPDSQSAFPNRAFTYFAAGLPVINNIRKGELENMIKEQNLGITMSIDDSQKISEAIRYCIDNYHQTEHERIREFAKKQFSKNEIYKEFYNWVIVNFGK